MCSPAGAWCAGWTDTSEDVIGALAAARLERQVILNRADPPDVVVVLDEAVLLRLIGTPPGTPRRVRLRANSS